MPTLERKLNVGGCHYIRLLLQVRRKVTDERGRGLREERFLYPMIMNSLFPLLAKVT